MFASFSEGWRKGFPFLLILKGRGGHPCGEGTVTSCRQGSSVAEATSGLDCPLQGYLEGLLGCRGDREALLPWSQVWGVLCAELSRRHTFLAHRSFPGSRARLAAGTRIGVLRTPVSRTTAPKEIAAVRVRAPVESSKPYERFLGHEDQMVLTVFFSTILPAVLFRQWVME